MFAEGKCVNVSSEWEDAFWAFMDLEKVYDTIPGES